MTTFYSVGHSTLALEDFIRLLQRFDVRLLVDVRAFARSRTHPQFNADTLAAALAPAGIGYEHVPALGGRRRRSTELPVSPNGYWQNQSFRNYADYAASSAFQEALGHLRSLGTRQRCAIMCAESLWWRCHRRIISDYLLAAGDQVLHIMGSGRAEPARMTEVAEQRDHGVLVYPGDGGHERVADPRG